MLNENSTLVEQDELENFRRQWQREVQEKRAEASKSKQAKPTRHDGRSTHIKATEEDEDNKVEIKTKEDSKKININENLVEETKTNDSTLVSQGSALSYYIRAVEKEKEGNLQEALISYRHAFKLDPDADITYKSYWREHIASTPDENGYPSSSSQREEDRIIIQQLYGDYTVPQNAHDPLANLLEELHNMNLEYTPLKPEKPIHIAKLPNELLISILCHNLSRSIEVLPSFSLVCRKFFLISRDSVIWRYLCEQAHCTPKIDWNQNRMELELAVTLYGGDWRRMFIERPRLRWDGVYISTCHYLRTGASENSWNQPIHMITYYRYLRFYPDGTCIKLRASDEPKDVVRNFTPTMKNNRDGFYRGSWKLVLGNAAEGVRVKIEMRDKDHRPGETFYLELRLGSTDRGKHNKFTWVNFESYNSWRDQRIDFGLKYLKPFFFSRVRSYVW